MHLQKTQKVFLFFKFANFTEYCCCDCYISFCGWFYVLVWERLKICCSFFLIPFIVAKYFSPFWGTKIKSWERKLCFSDVTPFHSCHVTEYQSHDKSGVHLYNLVLFQNFIIYYYFKLKEITEYFFKNIFWLTMEKRIKWYQAIFQSIFFGDLKKSVSVILSKFLKWSIVKY